MKQDRPLSYSALKQFSKSPAHLDAYWNRDLTQSASMAKGSLIHTLVLEPDTYDEKYAIYEGKVRRGKEYDAFCLENEGKIILNQNEFNEATTIRDAVWNNKIAKNIFLRTTEVESKFEMEYRDLKFKGIIDGIGNDFIFDLKTTQCSEPSKFSRDAFNYGYNLQAAIYLKAVQRKHYYIISVESAAPYNVTVFEMTSELINMGTQELETLITKFKAWDGELEGYTDLIEPLDVPQWMKNKEHELVDRF